MQVDQNDLTVFVMDDEGIILDLYEDAVSFGADELELRAWEMDTLEVDSPLDAAELAVLCADEDMETADATLAFFTGDFEAPSFADEPEPSGGRPTPQPLLAKIVDWCVRTTRAMS